MTRKILQVTVNLSLMLLVALGFFVAFSVWRLWQGPVSLDALTPILARNLQPEDGSFRVSFDQTVLVWDSEANALAIQVRGARAVDGNGKTIADAPAVQVNLSISALTSGVIAPTRAVILQPRIRLARKKDGSIDYGAIVESGPTGEKEGPKDGKAGTGKQFHRTKILPVLMQEVMLEPNPADPLSYLEEVSVLGAIVRIEDRMSGGVWNARDANLSFGRDVVGLRANFTANLDLGGKLAAISAAALYSKGQDEINATAGFRGVEPALIGATVPGLEALRFIKVPVNGDFSLVMSGAGKIADLKLTLGGRGGTLVLPDETGRELAVDTFRADVRLSPDLRRVELTGMEINLTDGPSIEAGGSMDVGSARRRTNVTATILNVDMATLDKFWPMGMAQDARDWITANVTAGEIPEIQAALSLRHLDGIERNESGAIVGGGATGWDVVYARGALLYSGLAVTYLEGLPPITAVSGHGTFSQDAFRLKIRQGALEKLKVSGGEMVIGGLQDEIQVSEIAVEASGALGEALRIIDYDRLGYARLIGVKPADMAGNIDMRLEIKMPLLKDLTFDQIDLNVKAGLANVKWPDALVGKPFSADHMDLDLTGKGMTLSGKGDLDGLGVDMVWKEDFSGSETYQRELKARGRFDLADMGKFGFSVAPYFTGPAPVDAVYRVPKGGSGSVAFDVDLASATISIPELAYEKPPGTAGKANFTLDVRDGVLRTAHGIKVTAAGFEMAGTIGFHPETGKVNSADMERFAFGRTDIKGKLRIDEDGDYRLVIAGPSLDISGFLTPGKNTGGADFKLPRLSAEGQVEKLYTRPDRFVGGARLDVRFDGEIWREIRFNGDLAPTGAAPARIDLSLLPKGGQRTLKIRSADGGAVMRALGITDDVIGGALRGDGTIDDSQPSRPLTATLRMNGIELKNAPAMARLLTLASLEGIAAALDGPGIKFTRLKVPFVLTEDRLVVREASAIGDDLGFTLQGVLDRKASTVNFEGTIVPSYTLNSLVGNIPILGQVLVGSKNSGIFAASFTMKGPLAKPEIVVNPVSILAPGILRAIVGGQVDGGKLKALPKPPPKKPEDGGPEPAPKPGGDPTRNQGGREQMGQ